MEFLKQNCYIDLKVVSFLGSDEDDSEFEDPEKDEEDDFIDEEEEDE